jgi:RNA polymerase sigma-70 factor (ECF subfamily)
MRSERALLRAASHGSRDALEDLARTHWPNAYRVALGITGDAAAAEDVAQEGRLSAVQALDRFDRRRPFGPWLHAIVTNRALDWVRARERRAEISLNDGNRLEEPKRMGDPAQRGAGDELLAALSSLEPLERAVVVLRHVLGYSSEEIGRMLDRPPGTVRSLLHRALTRLRSQLGAPTKPSTQEALNE